MVRASAYPRFIAPPRRRHDGCSRTSAVVVTAKTDLRPHAPVLAALMVAMALVALEGTIIATAVPSIVDDLGGFRDFPWLFSVYLLAQAVTMPLYSRAADAIGRKPVILIGITVFVVGSALCGLAWNMPMLIAARAAQGIGAGAIQPITTTILGDLFELADRARVQGYMATVWGVCSVLGPALGGLLSEFLSWRWIFLINAPIGAAALWMLLKHFDERITRQPARVDVLGAASLTTGCSLCILGLLSGGTTWAWGSTTSIAIFAVGAASLVVFVFAERRAAAPVLPLWIFRRRVLLAGNLSAVSVGALTIGIAAYLPTYIQVVHRTGPLEAGFALAAMTVGWPIATTQSGKLYLRIGVRATALIGTALTLAGVLVLVALTPASGVATIAAACFVIGLGLGLTSMPVTVALQSVVGWSQRGVVTGTNMFARSIGSAAGVAAFAAVADHELSRRLASAPAAFRGDLAASGDAFISAARNAGDSAAGAFLRASMHESTHLVFRAFLVVTVLGGLVRLFIPRQIRPVTIPRPRLGDADGP
jgi:EmrB/QacA subfamily drug resistance transporter